MDAVPVSRTCRSMKLLDVRSFELKTRVHEALDHVWKQLVYIDVGNGIVRIREKGDGKCFPSTVGSMCWLTHNR